MIDPALQRLAREAPYLGADEERDLIALAQAGDAAARDRVVLAHLRLVLKLSSKRKGYSVPLDDLVQDGIIGLMEAIDRFDLAQPVRFATYAAWWVKARFTEAAMRGHSLVRITTSAQKKALFFGLRAARAELEALRLPKHELVARLAARFDVAADTIREMTAYLAAGDASLNALAHVDGFEDLGDTIVDPGPLPDEIVDEVLDAPRRAAKIAAALAQLSDRERRIIEARVYVEPDAELTLDDLAGEYGISRERVRQIEVRALQKMKAATTGEPLVRKRGPGRSAKIVSVGRVSEIAKARVECDPANRESVVSLCKRLGLSRARVYQIEATLMRQRAAIAA